MNNIEEDEIDFGKIFLYLKKYFKMIIFITFIATTIATIYAYYLQSLYSSSVIISFSNQKMSKLASIIPEELSVLNNKSSKLEQIKLTIKTRKFIKSVIKDLNFNNRYFIQKKVDFIPKELDFITNISKKEEVYDFNNLEIELNILNNTLFDNFFKIKPLDEKRYILYIDKIKYKKIHLYNKLVKRDDFSIKVRKKDILKANAYFIKSIKEADIIDNILKNLKINILSDNVLEITYSDNVSKRAKELLDAIAKKFVSYTLQKKTNEITQTLIFLNSQIDEIKNTLKNKGDSLKKHQQQSNAFMPLESSKILIKNINLKKEKLKTLTFQLAEVKNFRDSLKNGNFNTVSLLNSGIDIRSIQPLIDFFIKENLKLNEMNIQSNNIEKAITTNPQLIDLINKLNKNSQLLIELELEFTAEHPKVIKIKKEIEFLREKIDSYINTTIERLKTNKKLTKSKIVKNIEMIEKSLKNSIAILKKDIKNTDKSLKLLPEQALSTQELKDNFTLSEKIYTFLLEKKMEFQIAKASTIANTEIIENPKESLLAVKPNKRLIIAIGFILGVILGLILTWLRVILDTKIRDVSTIEELSDIPVYGVLPEKEHKEIFEEALRSIRTNLQFALHNTKKCLTIMLSSTVSSEGKTTIISGLAKIISQTNKKVLLIDLDLRKPRLYKELGLTNKEGISNYLVTDNKDISDFIQPVKENLYFIASGPIPPNPSELLMSDKFNRVITRLKEEYDYILFDTAPIGSVIDASLLLQYTDITLLVLKADYSEKNYLEHFHKISKEKGIKSSGIILNKLKIKNKTEYGYAYGYGYGYGE